MSGSKRNRRAKGSPTSAKRAPEVALPDPLGDLEDLIAEAPLRAIDEVIERLRRCTGQPASSQLLVVLAIAAYRARDVDADDPRDHLALARRGLPKGDRRFNAAVLLRAIAANSDAFPDRDLRGYMRWVFDDAMSEPFRRKLDLSEDTFEARLIEIPRVVDEAESTLKEAIEAVSDYGRLGELPGPVAKALADPFVRAVIRPFLPAEALDEGLTRLCKSIQLCGRLSSPEEYGAYRQALRALKSYSSLVRAHDSTYSERYLASLASKLTQVIEEEYGRSPLATPADLDLQPGAKRYPLHEEGRELVIALSLTNNGGPALDVELSVLDGEFVACDQATHLLGDLQGGRHDLSLGALVVSATDGDQLKCELRWTSSDGTDHEDVTSVPILAQRPDVDWDGLRALNPYPNRAVEDPDRLAGREQLLLDLGALASGPEVGSTRISGQKRVGKSSIVRSLAHRLRTVEDHQVDVVFLDVARLGLDDDGESALAGVVQGLRQQLRRQLPELAGLVGEGRTAAQDLKTLLEELERGGGSSGARRVLLIIDEFDELPNDAFRRGGPADAFFRLLKAWSSDGGVGFFLVGGERLELALSQQGDRLNAFRQHRVSYIDIAQEKDYADLVKRPVQGILEYTGEAVRWLHERTAGHPYFTLLVCREVLKRATETRDAHVTLREMRQAYEAALASAPASAFAHVWFDHMFESPEVGDAIAARRIFVLMAWAQTMRRGRSPTVEAICEEAQTYGVNLAQAREELRSLGTRDLIALTDDRVHALSPFFEDWLREWGPERIIKDKVDSTAVELLAGREDRTRVTSAEIVTLRDRWEHYNSGRIQSEDIRGWIEQFGNSEEQRLAFTVASALQILNAPELHSLFRITHQEARRDVRTIVEPRKRTREFVIVYLEPVGKSASLMARHYAKANRLHLGESVNHVSDLDDVLSRRDVERVVIVDDFIGTGRTAKRLLSEWEGALRRAAEGVGRDLVFAVAIGFEEGMDTVEKHIAERRLPVALTAGEILTRANSAFAKEADIFENEEDRLRARQMFEDLARRLGSEEPLGTGDLAALVAFDHNCPNNTLPLIWKEVPGRWRPLFARNTTR